MDSTFPADRAAAGGAGPGSMIDEPEPDQPLEQPVNEPSWFLDYYLDFVKRWRETNDKP